VTVISYSFWLRRFGGAADAIGRTLTLDKVPFTIVGVTPANFFGAEVSKTFDVIVPLGDEPLLHGAPGSQSPMNDQASDSSRTLVPW
jgi:hypothetical protein